MTHWTPQNEGRRRTVALLCGLMLVAQVSTATAASGDPMIRVVYHIDDSSRAIGMLRNIGNHLRATPNVRIVVVALGGGIDFLLKGAKDVRGNPYEPMVDDLVMAGVSFRVCNNTLISRSLDRSAIHPEASIVESGVAEIARLESVEGFAYIKP